MSVKKLLVLAAAGVAVVAASAAMAGGPDHMAMPAAPSFQNSVYVDGQVGYAQSNWTDSNTNVLVGNAGNSYFAPTSNGKGGVTGGLDLGYNITPHIAVEGGWLHIPTVKADSTAYGRTNGSLATTANAKVSSWLAYMAAKLSIPVMQDLHLFGKVGVGYRSLSYSFSPALPATLNGTTSSVVSGDGHYWAPVFGTGLQYDWSDWQVGAQYLYVSGNDTRNAGATAFGAPNAAPEVNMYTAFLGYRFNV